MLRSWKFSVFDQTVSRFLLGALAMVLIAGCGAKVDRSDLEGGGGGNGNKPSDSEFRGEAIDFSGTWKGDCAIASGKSSQACTMEMTVQQSMALAGSSTLFLNFSITSGNVTRTYNLPFFLIDGNELKSPTNGGSGKIGSGAFVIYEDQFAGFSVRARSKDNKSKKALQLGILASRMPGASLTSTGGCSGQTCFAAILNKSR